MSTPKSNQVTLVVKSKDLEPVALEQVKLLQRFLSESQIHDELVLTFKEKQVGSKAARDFIRVFPPVANDATGDFSLKVSIQTQGSGGYLVYKMVAKTGDLTGQGLFDLFSQFTNQNDKQTWIPDFKAPAKEPLKQAVEPKKVKLPIISFSQLSGKLKLMGTAGVRNSIHTFQPGSGLISDAILAEVIEAVTGKELEPGKFNVLRALLVKEKILCRRDGENYYLVDEEEESKEVPLIAVTDEVKAVVVDTAKPVDGKVVTSPIPIGITDMLRVAKEQKNRQERMNSLGREIKMASNQIANLRNKVEIEEGKLAKLKAELADLELKEATFITYRNDVERIAEAFGIKVIRTP